MADEQTDSASLVILLPESAELPEMVRERLWQCCASVQIVSDPVEAVTELAMSSHPRTVLVVNSEAWDGLPAMRQSVARYWPDARVEFVDEQARVNATADKRDPIGSGATMYLARPVAALPRTGRILVNAIAITLLLITPVIWMIVLLRSG